ncbi:ABC transporter permease [Martelella sp. FLE1502]
MTDNPHVTRPASRPRQARSRARRKAAPHWVLNLGSLAIVLGLWWLAAAVLLRNESLLPLPTSVWEAFVVDLQDGSLWQNVSASLMRVLTGFAIGVVTAVPVGLMLGWYATVRGLAEPIIQFLRVIPPIAIIPLVIVYLGIGETAKIFLIWFSAFLTIVISVYGGMRSLDSTLIRAGRVLGARDFNIFKDIALPASVPFIFVGMRLGLATAWATLVAAELIASSRGLGFLIVQAGQFRDLPRVLVGILMIGLVGLIMDRLILRLDKSLTSWQEREER